MSQFALLTEALGGIRRLVAPLAVVAMMAASASAAPVEFADFNSPANGQAFRFTNNGGTSGSISVASAPINFNFTAATGLSTADRSALLTITGNTFTPATALGGGFIDQPISNISTLSITSGGQNLLTMTFTGDIIGRNANASLLGSDTSGQVVQFTSDFLTFQQPGNSYNLSLAAISPNLSIGAGGFLNSFLASINGQFTANIVSVPAPGSIAMFGTGIAAALVVATQRKRFAKLNKTAG